MLTPLQALSFIPLSKKINNLQDIVQLTKGVWDKSVYLWTKEDEFLFQKWWQKTLWFYSNDNKPKHGFRIIWGSIKEAPIWDYYT